MKKIIALLSGMSLAACSLTGSPSSFVSQPADPAVAARIAKACVASGLFKMADGALAFAVPAVALPVSVINAGVDKVCADPGAFAADISTVEWVIKNTVNEAKPI